MSCVDGGGTVDCDFGSDDIILLLTSVPDTLARLQHHIFFFSSPFSRNNYNFRSIKLRDITLLIMCRYVHMFLLYICHYIYYYA